MSLQLKFEVIPLHDLRGYFGSGVMHIVSSHSGEQFPLLVSTLPILELPVLSIDKYSNYTLPARLCEVCYAIVYVKCHCFIPDASSDLNNLRSLVIDNIVCTIFISFLIINSFFEEILDIVQGNIAWNEQRWHNYNRVWTTTKFSGYRFRLALRSNLLFLPVMIDSSRFYLILGLKICTSKFTSFAIGPLTSILSFLQKLASDPYTLTLHLLKLSVSPSSNQASKLSRNSFSSTTARLPFHGCSSRSSEYNQPQRDLSCHLISLSLALIVCALLSSLSCESTVNEAPCLALCRPF